MSVLVQLHIGSSTTMHLSKGPRTAEIILDGAESVIAIDDTARARDVAALIVAACEHIENVEHMNAVERRRVGKGMEL